MKMNKWMMFDANDGAGGTGSPANTPPTGSPPPPSTPSTPPVAPPATPPPSTPGTPPATPPAQPPASAEPASLLAGDPPDAAAPPGSKPFTNADGTPMEITSDTVEAFLKDIDLKFKPEGADKEVELDKEGLKIVLPDLMRLGATKEQVAAIAKASAAHQFKAMAAAAKRDSEFMGSMIAKTKETFGNDLPKVVSQAKRGGSALFGKELWAELSTVPAFSNDHRIINALAAYGRSISPDTGSDGGAAGGEKKGFVEEWTGKKI